MTHSVPDSDSTDEICSAVATVTVTSVLSQSDAPTGPQFATSSVVPPYPTISSRPVGVVPSGSAPSGSGVRPSNTPPPAFTGAAVAMNVPVGFFGVFGFVALLV